MAETRYEIGVLNYHCSTYESAIDFLNNFNKHKSGQPICVFYGGEDTEWRVLFAVGSSETDGTKYNILGEVEADDINEKIQWFSFDDEENIKTDGNTLRLVHDLTGDDDLDSLMSNNENVLFVGEGGGIGCIYHNGTLFSSPYIEDKILKEDLTIGETTYEAGSTLTSIIQDILEKINPDNARVDWDNIENKPTQVEDAFDCDSFMKRDENLSDLANKRAATQNLLSGLDGVANNTVLKFEDGAIKWGSTIIGWYDEDGNLKPGSEVKFVNISREEYNQLTTPPETTLYFVHEGSGTAEEYELYIGGHSLRTNSYHIAEAGETPEDVKKRYALTDSEGSVCGDYIDIPKDKFISHTELRTVTEPDIPYEGANVGDEYIDLEIMNCAEHIYIPLGDIDAPQADWNEGNSDSGAFIKNKPAIKAGQGENSIIEGNLAGNSATGRYSHAEGTRATASSGYSHAEGAGTTASGAISHAEGADTTASGDYSHAEGSGTKASGENSHAEGSGTRASGDYGSHAEGNLTTASGTSSHAEGYQTQATGSYSHAEGYQTTASGFYSHAEGLTTTASGSRSHTEGTGTTANHKSQHVFGEHNIADPSLNNTSARGNYVEIVGNGTDENTRSNARTLDWDGNETLAGNLTIGGTITANGQEITPAEPQVQADWNQSDSESPDFVKNRPFYEDVLGELVLSDTPVGGVMYFDWGEVVPVVGKSYSIEFDTDNNGDGILEHQTTTGIGQAWTEYSPEGIVVSSYAGALFYTPTNFSAEGHNVNGKFSGNPNLKFLRLVDSTVQKLDAKFIEPQVQADWNQTTNAGSDYIKNKPAIKAGQGNNSIIEGNLVGNSSTGKYSHAEGNGTTASGENSHAEGGYTTASGGSSHAEGNITTASGNFSHAEGGEITASGDYSHAEGRGTTASGNQSHAEGFSTSASGTNSHAEGLQTTASGSQSHAEGYGTTATHKSQHVFGECNIADPSLNSAFSRGTYIEIVGNGANVEVKSNARTLDWSGNETLAGNLIVGGTITANGQQILPQKQADWNQTTSTGSDYIKNKPTKLSDFINDGEGGSPVDPFVTESDVDEIRDVISNGATSQNKLITQSEAQELVNVLSLSPIMADASGTKSFDFESPMYGALVSGSTNLEAGPWYKNEGNGFEVCNSTTGVYVSLNDSAVVIDDESLFFYFAHGYRYQRIKMGVQGVYGKIKTPYGETVDLNYTDGSTLSGKFANTPCIYFYDDNNMFGHSGRVIYVCRATNLVSKTNAAEEYLVGASDTINDIMQGTDPDNTYDLVYPTTKYVCTQAQTASTDPVWAYRVTISESSSLADVAFTGSYADLQNTPTKLSDFTNDGNGGLPLNPFVTRNELEATQAEWDYIMGN